jgi:hypothetical protein
MLRRTSLLSCGTIVALAVAISSCRPSQSKDVSKIEPIALPSSTPPPKKRGNAYPRRPFQLVDDAERYRGFYQFRQQLRQAIQQRNAKFIRAISTKDIQLTLGRFPQTWSDEKLDDPKAPIWQELEKTFALGCRTKSQGKGWICPNVFEDWADNLNPFDHVVILQSKVSVYAQASKKAPVIGLLSKEIVKLDRELQNSSPFLPNWNRIILPNGRLGFVEEKFAYSPIGYRTTLSKTKDDWKMDRFLGGD